MIIIENSKSKFNSHFPNMWLFDIQCIQQVMNKNSEVFVSLCQRANFRDRALDHMMLGALEVKKEDILKVVGQNIHTFVKG